MLRALCFLGRYELPAAAPRLRTSAASVVHATDCTDSDAAVVLKLMSSRAPFLAELAARDAAAAAAAAAAAEAGTELCVDCSAASTLGDALLPLLRAHVVGGRGVELDGAAYCYVLVMPRGAEDLASRLAHSPLAADAARGVAQQLAHCLAALHEAGTVHGGFKPANAVCVPAAGSERWRLIDLAAAAAVGSPLLGAALSTAYAPPEALTPRAMPLGPRGAAQEGGYCVRGTGTGASAAEPLLAAPSYDIWAWGAVAYELLLAESLWHGTAAGGLARATDWPLLAEWPSALKAEALGRLPSRPAAALLGRVLARDPAARPPSLRAVLKHPFFQPPSAPAPAPPLPAGSTAHVFIRRAQSSLGWAQDRC